MILSFNGSYRPYTYNCAQAFKFRAIDKIFPERTDEGIKPEDAKDSRRKAGIIRHDEFAAGLEEFMETFEYPEVFKTKESTDDIFLMELLDEIKKQRGNMMVVVETPVYTDLDYNYLPERPSTGHAIYARPDLILLNDGVGRVVDWKFGTPNFGASTHYREVEWFLTTLAGKYFEISEWEVYIHFPAEGYTLPERRYLSGDILRIQNEFKQFTTAVTERKIFLPYPARSRCRLCDYRAEVNGGIGNCEDAILFPV